MTRARFRTAAGLMAVGLAAVTTTFLTAGQAFALPPGCNPGVNCFQVVGTNGSLEEHSTPNMNTPNIGSVPNGAWIGFVCQTIKGSTDDYDGNYSWTHSTTWDEIATGVWVYDHFLSTPPQGPSGYSWAPPNSHICPGG